MPVSRPRRSSIARFDGLRTIVVDDDAPARRLVRQILEQDGMAVDEAGNLAELFRFLEGGTLPDAVVLDLSMPGGSGWTALPRLRDAGEIPVVIMTGYDDDEFRASAKARGVASYIVKPFRPWDLSDAVERAIDAKRRKDPWSGSA